MNLEQDYIRGHSKAAGVFAFLSGMHLLWLIYYHIKSRQEYGSIILLMLLMNLCCLFSFVDRAGGELLFYQTHVETDVSSPAYIGEMILYQLLQSIFLISYAIFFLNNSDPYTETHTPSQKTAFKVVVYIDIFIIFIHTALVSYIPFQKLDLNSISYQVLLIFKSVAIILFFLINVFYSLLYWEVIATVRSPITLKINAFAKYALICMGLMSAANLLQMQTILAPINPQYYNATTLLMSEILAWTILLVLSVLKVNMDTIATKNDENNSFQASPTKRNPSSVMVKVTRLV